MQGSILALRPLRFPWRVFPRELEQRAEERVFCGPLLWRKEEEPGREQTIDGLTHTRAAYMANMRRSLSPKGLIQRLNRKLAGERKVVGKTLGKSRSQKRGKYYLLDHSARTTRDLSLRELESIARELGVLAQDENLSTPPSAPMEGVAPASTDR